MKNRVTSQDVNVKLQDSKSIDKTEQNKVTLKSVLQTANGSSGLKTKPLAGKLFYLDLPFSKTTEALEKDIQKLGGTIERFFSKDIRYLVSNKKEAKFVKSVGRNSPLSSPGSPNTTGNSSPCLSSRRGSCKVSSQDAADAIKSRGKSLVEKVVKEQELIQTNRILSNALDWGVKILYIDDILSYIEKKKKDLPTDQPNLHTSKAKKTVSNATNAKTSVKKNEVGNLKKPFLKVEDQSRHYKPIYLSLPNLPELNFCLPAPCCPFESEKTNKDRDVKKQREHGNKVQRHIADEANCTKQLKAKLRALDLKEKKKRGYCECCVVKYENLKAHLSSERHKAFSTSDEYFVVDKVTSELVCDFVEIQNEKGERCSSATYSHASASAKTLDQRRKMHIDVDKCSNIEEASILWNHTAGLSASCSVDNTVAVCRAEKLLVSEKSTLQRKQNGRSVPNDCVFETPQNLNKPHSPSEKEGKNKTTVCPDLRLTSGFQNERKMLINLSAPCAAKISEASISVCTIELNLGNGVGQKIGKRTIGESTLGQSQTEDNLLGIPAKSQKIASSQLDVPESVESELFCNSNLNNLIIPDKGADNTDHYLSRTHSSPVGKLQRKVKPFRRTRRASERETLQKHSKQNDVELSPPLHNLWQHFQSSENVDWEFLGFPDCSG
ncbi:protein DBF4 homolog A [Lepisosteus oculatus]|uniref:protein DBF4 homolog A n=1 Tax=Lepisosteus oculatus TaxID=7918 RepID=UPI0035F53014